VEWRPRVNFFTNRTKIVSLGTGINPFNSGGFGATYGANRIQPGLSATAILGSENLTAGIYNGSKPAGDAMPDFQVGFANTLRVAGLELYFLFDWRQGGSVVYLTQDLFDENGLSPDVEAAAKRVEVVYGGASRPYSPYIVDGSFVKLREASLTYTINKDVLAGGFLDAFDFIRLGLTGRNLLMFTSYRGYDPEVSNFGNQVTAAGQDVSPFPSSRSYYLSISVGF